MSRAKPKRLSVVLYTSEGIDARALCDYVRDLIKRDGKVCAGPIKVLLDAGSAREAAQADDLSRSTNQEYKTVNR